MSDNWQFRVISEQFRGISEKWVMISEEKAINNKECEVSIGKSGVWSSEDLEESSEQWILMKNEEWNVSFLEWGVSNEKRVVWSE